jgi:agmatinase
MDWKGEPSLPPALPWVEPGHAFLGATAAWEDSRTVLVGVPLDATASFRPGARFAPRRIRQMSDGLEEYSLRLGRTLAEAGLYDAGDLLLAPGAVAPSLGRIEECVAWLAARGKRVALLGGEHLLTYPAVKALARAFPGLVVLQWDAHADRRPEYLGEEMSHATVMHLVDRLGVPVYQMGIRSRAAEELAAVRPLLGGCGPIFPEEVAAGMAQVLPELRGRPLYLSCDIDVLDPAYAPGTGTPEPGGVAPREIFAAIGHLRGLNLVGFDVVEVNPLVDVGDCTSLLAAKIVRELVLASG